MGALIKHFAQLFCSFVQLFFLARPGNALKKSRIPVKTVNICPQKRKLAHCFFDKGMFYVAMLSCKTNCMRDMSEKSQVIRKAVSRNLRICVDLVFVIQTNVKLSFLRNPQ